MLLFRQLLVAVFGWLRRAQLYLAQLVGMGAWLEVVIYQHNRNYTVISLSTNSDRWVADWPYSTVCTENSDWKDKSSALSTDYLDCVVTSSDKATRNITNYDNDIVVLAMTACSQMHDHERAVYVIARPSDHHYCSSEPSYKTILLLLKPNSLSNYPWSKNYVSTLFTIRLLSFDKMASYSWTSQLKNHFPVSQWPPIFFYWSRCCQRHQ
jgi:hypothetical protein